MKRSIALVRRAAKVRAQAQPEALLAPLVLPDGQPPQGYAAWARERRVTRAREWLAATVCTHVARRYGIPMTEPCQDCVARVRRVVEALLDGLAIPGVDVDLRSAAVKVSLHSPSLPKGSHGKNDAKKGQKTGGKSGGKSGQKSGKGSGRASGRRAKRSPR